ncbi:helix-turn-helix domain-containing protein [Streptomyces sp. MST-110588]|uniref:helix-turn-helix domain-containing protein n=1 Tax=Streptomyces sp. MST-110588 TaxID=2833628 RepID=UPI001F5C694E|nr:helix-turn-helix domain-containing protein [Streptomyces sp. MST-110588]UNO42657.1 helix-turn-helix domain-containing protein [Streptomyces sp. MST-110588]
MRMHGTEVRQKALILLRSGSRNTDVARALDVPPGTIGYWLHMDRAKRGACPGRGSPNCPRCHGGELDQAAYSYLLALYLGDGHIIQYSRHRVPSLMITCTETWPGLMDACEAAMRAVFPDNSVCRLRRTGCRNVKIYSKHLWCMFPQHGPGKKHERLIALEPWQQKIVEAYPWEFVRGLIHSDGCRITNWTVRTVGGVRKRYEYPRYIFTNTSTDILKLYTDTLDKLGVEWKNTRQSRDAKSISVARRASVALMDVHIGPKY